MKITSNIHGKSISIKNDFIKDLVQSQECKILLTFDCEETNHRIQFLLNKLETETLVNSLNKSMNIATSEGFKIV